MPTIVLPHMREKIYKSIGVSVVSILLPACLIFVYSWALAKAVLMGALMWAILQGLCAVRLFHQIETTPKKFILKFYQAEVAKLLLISTGFICLYQWAHLNLVGLLIGYMWAQVLFLGSMFRKVK